MRKEEMRVALLAVVVVLCATCDGTTHNHGQGLFPICQHTISLCLLESSGKVELDVLLGGRNAFVAGPDAMGI